MKTIPSSIIDFHVHLFPEKGFDAIWEFFAARGAPVVYQYYSRQCIEYLQAHGVDTIVYSNYAHRKGIAGPVNEWNLDLLEEFPNLYCFAAYHPDDDNAFQYAEQMLSHPRVAGIKMHFQVQKIYPHDKRLFPLYEMLIDRNKRILMHVGNGPTDNEWVGFDHFKKLIDHFPDLPVNVPHMGCAEFGKFIEFLDEHPNIYLDTAYVFWPNLPWTFNLEREYLEKYKDRILYGSDFPNVILPREGEIENLLSFGLSQEFYDKVFYTNGMKLIKEICPASSS
jgi:predicted TIM-barrel fold metal-dependent hydrolase